MKKERYYLGRGQLDKGTTKDFLEKQLELVDGEKVWVKYTALSSDEIIQQNARNRAKKETEASGENGSKSDNLEHTLKLIAKHLYTPGSTADEHELMYEDGEDAKSIPGELLDPLANLIAGNLIVKKEDAVPLADAEETTT